ncbi:MAG: apolipoprotein N-acyltransferase [Deltaproteobacteria bacterium]|nr:apolipoprotein N-acyltransferase [Deltaproteobacteria bacterium]
MSGEGDRTPATPAAESPAVEPSAAGAAGPEAPSRRRRRPPERLPLWPASLLSLLSGALYVLGVPPFDLAPLGWFGLLPLLVAVEGASYRRVFWCSWLVGLVTNIGGFPWITELLVNFGGLPVPLAVLLHGLMGAYQALMFPVAALAATWLRRSNVPFAAAWVGGFLLSDFLFPMIFPWYLAMTQYRILPVVQVADVVGVVGVTALLVSFNAALYQSLAAATERLSRRPAWLPPPGTHSRRSAARAGTVVAALVVAILAYGIVQQRRYETRRAGADRVPVGLVQPNIGIREKRDALLHHDHLRKLQALTANVERRGAMVAVWPESAYPGGMSRKPPAGSDELRDQPERHPLRIRRGFDLPLVFGSITRGTDPPRRYNSAFLLDTEGRLVGPVDKNVLLVFGEYIPLRDWLTFLDRWFPRAGSLAAGTRPGILPLGNLRLGILNCYEDILPAYVGRMMRAGQPHVLVNITNDAWFGRSAEPFQHLALAIFRCVEQRREMVRAVNTGVSAHVAATGEILLETPIFAEAAPVVEVVPYGGRTVYGRVGDVPGWVALAGLVVWAAAVRLRRRARQSCVR